MSVLKYLENGEWKGLNVDHASTADSCLYDVNGNPIISTYATKLELPTKVSDLQNDSGYITSAALSGYVASITTANLTVSDTAPSSPSIGDIWIDTSNL